eukprot:g25691.t2
MAITAWAVASLIRCRALKLCGADFARLLGALGEAAVPQLPEFDGQSLSNLLWGLAVARQAAEKLLMPLTTTSHSRGGHAERVAMLQVFSAALKCADQLGTFARRGAHRAHAPPVPEELFLGAHLQGHSHAGSGAAVNRGGNCDLMGDVWLHISHWPSCAEIYSQIRSAVKVGMDYLLSAREDDPFEDMPGRYAWEQATGVQAPSFDLRNDETVLVLVSLLSGEALAEFAAPKRSTVHDLRLVRKEAINFQWQATVGDGNCITSPEWCLDSSEAVSSRRCALSLRYYPTGFESKMLKDGNFSIMVQRPKSSILHARVHIAGVMRERLFTSAHGTLEGWINFASQEVLPTLCCTLEPDFILWLPWVQSSDFEAHPLDPPLSDAGRAEAKEVGKRIAQFIEAKPGSDIQVVVTSPYLRCIETAAAICLRLGSQTRLMVDLGLGEVYGPEIFGEEPQRTIRSSQEHLKSFADSPDPTAPLRASPSGVTFRPPISTVGVWPTWPETLAMGRRRFAERLLVYISRGAKARLWSFEPRSDRVGFPID